MRELVIVGGGLAGLTLGILLRRFSIPVTIWETGTYPRHRVCGEFISGKGADQLLTLLPELGRRILPLTTVRFFSGRAASDVLALPRPGLSISRWELDSALAECFERQGGNIHTARWTEPFATAGVVRATGRKLMPKQEHWTGLKVHLRKWSSASDLEMHFSNAGYVGISRLPEGANVCALVRSDTSIAGFKAEPVRFFAQHVGYEASANQLRSAMWDKESVCAVTGVFFGKAAGIDECSVGDAIRMIPPFTGNGMSLAIESAFTAAPFLKEYAEGTANWGDVVQRLQSGLRREFRGRFSSATVLGQVALRGWTRALMLSILRTNPRVLSLCFGATR